MQWHVRTKGGVRMFAAVVALVAATASFVLQMMIFPADVMVVLWLPALLITIAVSAPIAYFVGLKMLDIHRLTRQLEHAVNHDPLTETCSRLAFYERATAQDSWPMMVIATDIDHFKSVNDRYGHQAGDAVLKQFAMTLIRNCREDDIVARFGGEEFVMLLRADKEAEAVAAAERLRACVAAKAFEIEGGTVAISASFGVAEVADKGQINAALHRADQALYQAKEAGRNRVCVYSEVAAGATAPRTSKIRPMPDGAAGVA